MASKWITWQDVKGYDRKSWAWSTAQLFVPHHQWTFKIDSSWHGKVQLQVYDHQDRIYNHEYDKLEDAKAFAEQLVDKWRAQAVASGNAWSFDDFPEHQRRGVTMSAPTLIKYHGHVYKRAGSGDADPARTFKVKGRAVEQYLDGKLVHSFAGDFLSVPAVLQAMLRWLTTDVSFGHVQQAVANSYHLVDR